MAPRAARRKLEYHNFCEVMEDLDRLRAGGYVRAGRWDLAQTCEHLATFMEMSLTGFTFKFPPGWRLLGATVLKRLTLWTRSLPQGFKAPPELIPQSELTEGAAVAALKDMLCRVRTARRFAPSPLFGRMNPEQWRRIHLIHCAHHLSFVVPNQPAGVSDPAPVAQELSAG